MTPVVLERIAALTETMRLSAAVEVEITSKAKSEPLLVVLHSAKETAIAALDALVSVDPEKPAEIRALQNQVQRFLDMAGWLNQMLMDGLDAQHELNELQRQEAASFVMSEEDALALGISNEGGPHDD